MCEVFANPLLAAAVKHPNPVLPGKVSSHTLSISYRYSQAHNQL